MSAFRVLALVALVAAGPVTAQQQKEENQPEDRGVMAEPGARAESAESPAEEERTATSYYGIGLSRATADFVNVESAVNLDFALGWKMGWASWLAAELDGSFTIVPGDFKGERPCETQPASPPPPVGTGEPERTVCAEGNYTRSENGLQMTNVGVFAAVRSPGRLYGVGKYGYRIINCSLPEIQDGDDTKGTAWSAGAGWRWGEGLAGAEVSYTEMSSQIEYIGLTIAYGFGATPTLGAR